MLLLNEDMIVVALLDWNCLHVQYSSLSKSSFDKVDGLPMTLFSYHTHRQALISLEPLSRSMPYRTLLARGIHFITAEKGGVARTKGVGDNEFTVVV